jgi:WD40 repeat protein
LYDDNFPPDQLGQIPDAFSGDDARLMDELQALYQPQAADHARSLERVRARLAQREALKRNSRVMQEVHTEGRIIAIQNKKIMEDQNASWGMNPSTPSLQTKKRSSIVRIIGMSLVAAVAVITILSFTVFSGALQFAPQTAGNKTSTITGAQQKTISNAKLVCNLAVDDLGQLPLLNSSAQVDWPVQGKVVAHSSKTSVIFSAKDCNGKKTLTNENHQAAGSPDGKKIATASYNTDTLDIEDSDGNTVKSITFAQLGTNVLPEMVWSSDSTKLFFIAEGANYASTINSIDTDGGNLKTLLKLDNNNQSPRGFIKLSPAGKYALMFDQKAYSIWDVNNGKKVSEFPSTSGKSDKSLAFSPDSSLLAIGEENQISIFSTANGESMTTLNYKGTEDLAWSPDGKYLAVCSTAISIYDVNAKRAVTTFGKVADPAREKVVSLAWSPDGTGLVSSLEQPDDGKASTPVSIWALS